MHTTESVHFTYHISIVVAGTRGTLLCFRIGILDMTKFSSSSRESNGSLELGSPMMQNFKLFVVPNVEPLTMNGEWHSRLTLNLFSIILLLFLSSLRIVGRVRIARLGNHPRYFFLNWEMSAASWETLAKWGFNRLTIARRPPCESSLWQSHKIPTYVTRFSLSWT